MARRKTAGARVLVLLCPASRRDSHIQAAGNALGKRHYSSEPKAQKGRYNQQPTDGYVPPLQGKARILNPRTDLCGPFGARFQKRNSTTRKRGLASSRAHLSSRLTDLFEEIV